MKKIRSFVLLATLLSALSVPAVATTTAPVQLAQASPPFGCRSENGYGAWGIGAGYSPDQACANARMFCAQNAVPGTFCVTVNWWRNY